MTTETMHYQVLRLGWGKSGGPTPKLPTAAGFPDGTIIKFQGDYYTKMYDLETQDPFWSERSRWWVRKQMKKEIG